MNNAKNCILCIVLENNIDNLREELIRIRNNIKEEEKKCRQLSNSILLHKRQYPQESK